MLCNKQLSYQGGNSGFAIYCGNCLECPPHPADVPEQFVEAITFENMITDLEEMIECVRRI